MNDDQRLGIYLRLALEGLDAWQKRQASCGREGPQSAFLAHTVSTVPFYRNLFADAREVPSLSSFPLMARERIYRSKYEFRSEEFVAESENLFAHTNGTIARKLQVHFDRAGWYHFNYHLYEMVAQLRPDVAAKIRPGHVGVVLVTDSPYEDGLDIILPALNASLWRRVNLGCTEDEERAAVEFARTEPIPILYGKPSVLLLLARSEARRFGSSKIRPGMILTSGENLYSDHRRLLREWYKAEVYDAYIATEAGMIGLECGYGTGRHARPENVTVEVAQPDGSIASEGTGEILITNLANWGHAFVRYRLGDQVTIANVECGCGYRGPSILEIFGREANGFDSTAGRIRCADLSEHFRRLGVSDYQVIQDSKSHFSIRWTPSEPALAGIAKANAQIASVAASLFGGVEVDVLPVHRLVERGGKLRRFIVR